MARVNYHEVMIGKFHRLTPLGADGHGPRGHILWRFKCDCGREITIPAFVVHTGRQVSCGCKRHPDITGQRFGRLIVVERDRSEHGQRYWRLRCDCGNEHVAQGTHLKSGSVQSCGCLQGGTTATLFNGLGEIGGQHWNRIAKAAVRRSRTLPYDLTIEQGWALFLKQNRRCALTGRQLSFKFTPGSNGVTTASLDRIDSDHGYVLDNVQWVHKDLNMMKSNMPQSEFITWCKRVADHTELQ